MGFCQDCLYWEEAFKRDKAYGACDHPLVPDEVLMDKEDQSDGDEKVIHTQQYFGCINFEPKHGNIVARINFD